MTDREKLIELIQSAVDGCATYWAGLIADHLIANGVTVRKHGRWISYPDCGVTKCSVCDWSIEECIDYDFCPNCGAKMDLEG